MWFSSWKQNEKRSASDARRRMQTVSRQRTTFRPRLEVLEDRWLPSNYTAASVSALIADINAANKAGGTNTINLAANTTFDLTAVNNTTNGANGLPVISGGGQKVAPDNLTIIGSGGDIIQRDPAGTPAFRLFDVASGGSLTLQNVTLQGGLAFGSGAAADGGAIYNQGTLTLINTIVQNNTAQGSNGLASEIGHKNKLIAPGAGAAAEGGGIWTNGTVKLESGTVIGGSPNWNSWPPQMFGEGNRALGGNGGTAFGNLALNGGTGGGAFGGGLYQAGGSVTMSNATVVGNQAVGGSGGYKFGISGNTGNGGAASGGGLFMTSGTLVMSNDTVENNTAMGGNGGGGSGSGYLGNGGAGSGGGVYVGGGTVTLQAVQLLSNRAQGGDGGEYHFTEGVTIGAIESDRGFGGSGLGGGLYVGGGTVTLTGDTVTGNAAYAGGSGSLGVPTGSPGVAAGGGIYIAPGATVSLDSFTVTNTTNNYDYVESSLSWTLVGEDDIDGSYTLI